MISVIGMKVDFKCELPKDLLDNNALFQSASFLGDTIKKNVRRGYTGDGKRLKSLSKRTIADKKRLGYGLFANDPLIRTERMVTDIRAIRRKKNKYEIGYDASSKRSRKIAEAHHKGRNTEGKVIPKRPFFAVSKKSVTESFRIFSRIVKSTMWKDSKKIHKIITTTLS